MSLNVSANLAILVFVGEEKHGSPDVGTILAGACENGARKIFWG